MHDIIGLPTPLDISGQIQNFGPEVAGQSDPVHVVRNCQSLAPENLKMQEHDWWLTMVDLAATKPINVLILSEKRSARGPTAAPFDPDCSPRPD